MKRFAIALISFYTMLCNAQTTITLTPSEDVSIGFHDGANTAGNNYGSAIQNAAFWVPAVASPPPGVNGNRALIKFNLAAIPVNATLTSAFLNLYATGPLGSVQGHFGNNACYLERITQNWQEFAATWNNQPAATSQNSIILPQSTSATQNYLNINVLTLVQDMINNPASGFGFKLRLISETLSCGLLFCSKDHSDQSRKPQLIITYKTCDMSPVVLAGATNICSGHSASLVASGNSGSICWYASSTTTNVLSQGNTYITPLLYATGVPQMQTYYSSTACSPGRNFIHITVNPTPTVVISSSNDVLCKGSAAILSVSGAVNFTWSPASLFFNQPSFVVTPAVTTVYTVLGSNGFNCTASAMATLRVDACTGVAANNIYKNDFVFFTDPLNNHRQIKRASSILPLQVIFEDLQGRLVRSFEWRVGESLFNIHDQELSHGLYICRIMQGVETMLTKKMAID